MKLRHCSAIALTASVLLLAGGCGGAPSPTAERPEQINVLLVTIDTLRYDYLGCYSNETVSTPLIDGIAAEGALFEFCAAHNTVTLPSHVSILTGTDATVHGVHDNSGYRLGPEADTLAELLRNEGYETGAFVGAFVLDRRFGLDQGFDRYDDDVGVARADLLRSMERRADKVVAPALEWISSREGPWFAWVHVYDPHAPYAPPPPFDERFAGDPYSGEISYTDNALAPIFEHLRDSGALDSTVVVITADHGEGLGEHGELTHGVFAYNTTLRVPLVIRAPWAIAPGVRVERRVRHIDLLPTVLDLAGIDASEEKPGESLVASTGQDGSEPPRDSYFEALSASLNRGWAPLTGTLSGKWKYIDLPIPELYDMESDPAEASNQLAGMAGTAAGLRQSLRDYCAREGAGVDARIEEDAETMRRLQALGYLTSSAAETKDEYGPGDDPKNLIHLDEKLEIGSEAARNGDTERAEALFREVIAERPEMAFTYRLLAQMLSDNGNKSGAIELLETAVARGAGGRGLLSLLATTLLEAGSTAEALQLLEELMRGDPGDYHLPLSFANWLSSNGDGERARGLFERIVETAPQDASVRAGCGWMHMRAGRLDDAMEQFNTAVSIDPENLRALHGRGLVYEQLQMWSEAAQAFRRVLEVNPDHHYARLRLGLALLQLGDGQAAKEELSTFLQRAPRQGMVEEKESARAALARIR